MDKVSPNVCIALKRTLIAFATSILAAAPVAASQDAPLVLRTSSYVIAIRVLCEEGVVDCDNVEYRGMNQRTGKAIHLKGQDWIRYCLDDQGDGPGNTPCQHLGYEFKRGDIVYYVGDDGTLQVVQGGKRVLLEERGKWDDEQ